MKTLLLHVIALCAAVLPVTQAQAVEPAGKKYGDFKPGDSFYMKVSSLSEIGTRPGDFPKFRPKQIIKFTIGPKGQLTGDGFSINFEPKGTTKGETTYDNATSSTHTLVHQAVVQSNGIPLKPYNVNLILRSQNGTNFYQGQYSLGPK